MVDYTKPWLSLEQQVERLASRGVEVGDRDRAVAVLKAVGYHRLTGYLYPFRESEQYIDDSGRERTRVLGGYRTGTRLDHAEAIIDFDRRLRMLVMDGVERVEVAVRMQLGYVLGRSSPFAHEDRSLALHCVLRRREDGFRERRAASQFARDVADASR